MCMCMNVHTYIICCYVCELTKKTTVILLSYHQTPSHVHTYTSIRLSEVTYSWTTYFRVIFMHADGYVLSKSFACEVGF